jgi:hypothetical protein
MTEFITECYQVNRMKITQADIDKFMKAKPELTAEDVLKNLPHWLHNLHDTFLPCIANKLVPR